MKASKQSLLVRRDPVALSVKLFGEVRATDAKIRFEQLDVSVVVDIVSNWYQDKKLFVYMSRSAFDRHFEHGVPAALKGLVQRLDETARRYDRAH